MAQKRNHHVINDISASNSMTSYLSTSLSIASLGMGTAILSLALSLPSSACDVHGITGIVEDNDLSIPYVPGAKNLNGMTEEVFSKIIDDVAELHRHDVEKLGGRLELRKNWTDGTVNAYASQEGATWYVHMFGGLARHETITPDGFAMVVCHELGHHIGGAPKFSGLNSWATVEGQADYFASLKCMRRYYEAQDDLISRTQQMNIDPEVKKQCALQFGSETDQVICQRSAMGGLSLARLFQSLRREERDPKFTEPDPRQVSTLQTSHPATQCRLDTYYQGALCTIHHRDQVSQRDPDRSVCHEGMPWGFRPRCWYSREKSPKEDYEIVPSLARK